MFEHYSTPVALHGHGRGYSYNRVLSFGYIRPSTHEGTLTNATFSFPRPILTSTFEGEQ